MDKSTHQIRCEQWATIINACLSSGMRKKDWCQANGVSEKSFYYWQRILRNEAYIEQKQMPAIPQADSTPVAFVELKPSLSTTKPVATFRPDIVIRRGELTLEISNTASSDLLEYLGGLLHA